MGINTDAPPHVDYKNVDVKTQFGHQLTRLMTLNELIDLLNAEKHSLSVDELKDCLSVLKSKKEKEKLTNSQLNEINGCIYSVNTAIDTHSEDECDFSLCIIL